LLKTPSAKEMAQNFSVKLGLHGMWFIAQLFYPYGAHVNLVVVNKILAVKESSF
jgi:hypothetical protein